MKSQDRKGFCNVEQLNELEGLHHITAYDKGMTLRFIYGSEGHTGVLRGFL